jgi:hypothetical protein
VRGLLVYVHYKSTRPLHAVVRPPVLCHILLCRVVHGMHKLRTDAWKFRQIFKRVGSPESTTTITQGAPPQKGVGRTSVVLGVQTTAARDSAWRGVSSPARSWERREPGDIQAQRAALPTRTVRVSTRAPLHTDNLHSVNIERLSRVIHPFFIASVSLLSCCALAQTSTLQRWPTL